MTKRKFELDADVYFFTNVAKLVTKGKIVGLWVFGKEKEEVFNYQIEYTKETEVDGKKKKEKVIEVVIEENITISKEEMKEKFIPYMQKAIENKIKLIEQEQVDMDKRIEFINEEKVEAGKYILELQDILKKSVSGEMDIE
jgi:hypothetical protein